MFFDLSLKNEKLYKGCEIEEVAGRLNLKTPTEQAVTVIGRNMRDILADIPAEQREEIVLTGPMAVWSYLIVFHFVVHAFREVYYSDGKSQSILIARHG